MSYAVRHLEKFTSLNGATTYSFPLVGYEYDAEQSYRDTLNYTMGDYAVDSLGAGRWRKQPGKETVRFHILGASPTALDSMIDSLLAAISVIGLGKLYTVGADGTERWCYAKLSARPQAPVRIQSWLRQPISMTFVRLSDWLSTSLTSGTITLSSTPRSFTINNSGNAVVKGAGGLLLTLRSGSATGFTNPQLVNSTTSQQINSSRDATSSNSRLRIDCEKEAVQYSNDNGATWGNDYANVTLPAVQQGLMSLAPGTNSFVYTDGGAVNAYLDYQFYPAYE